MIAKKAEDSRKEEMEEELEFWTKGQGQIRERAQTADENAFDEEAAVKELDGRMTKLEGQMSDLLTTIKDGFETMKLPRKLHLGHFTMRKSAKGPMVARPRKPKPWRIVGLPTK